MLVPSTFRFSSTYAKAFISLLTLVSFPEAAVLDLLVLLEEAEFAAHGTLVGEVDGEPGVGFGVGDLFFEDGGELDVGWVSFDGWVGGE